MKCSRSLQLLFKSFACAVVVCCMISLSGFSGSCEAIEKHVFRLHILANSDSEQDQWLKMELRDELLHRTEPLFRDCHDKTEAMYVAKEHLAEIEKYAADFLHQRGVSYPVSAEVTRTRFDTRVYERFTLPSGEYDALRIVIGEGKGHNWWCVLFPALCLPASEVSDFSSVLSHEEQETVTEQCQVKFKVVECFEWFCGLFR